MHNAVGGWEAEEVGGGGRNIPFRFAQQAPLEREEEGGGERRRGRRRGGGGGGGGGGRSA